MLQVARNQQCAARNVPFSPSVTFFTIPAHHARDTAGRNAAGMMAYAGLLAANDVCARWWREAEAGLCRFGAERAKFHDRTLAETV